MKENNQRSIKQQSITIGRGSTESKKQIQKLPMKKQCFYPSSKCRNTAKIQNDPKWHSADLKYKKYLAFGDSFVNMFLHVKNAFHIKMKGKSLKGLSKPFVQGKQNTQNQTQSQKKDDKKLMKKWIDATSQQTQLIFNFGQVDLNFMRYYKILMKETYPQQTFKDYVNWVSSLGRKAIILGVLPCAITGQHIINVLKKYGTIPKDQSMITSSGTYMEPIEDFTQLLKQFEQTEARRKRWNQLLQKACKQTQNVRYINAFENKNKQNYQLEPRFLDQNPQTIHLRYLPTILQIKKHIPNLQIDEKQASRIQNQYQKVKTQKYYSNLKQIQQRKRLESLQQEGTQIQKINSNQSDTTSQNYNRSQSESTDKDFNVKNKRLLSSSDEQLLIQQESTKKIQNEEKQQKQKNRFIVQFQIPGIKTVDEFFKILFMLQEYSVKTDLQKQNKQKSYLKVIVNKIIQKGLEWRLTIKENTQNNTQSKQIQRYKDYQNSLLSLIKDIYSLQQRQSSENTKNDLIDEENFMKGQKISKEFFKEFVSSLQQHFQNQSSKSIEIQQNNHQEINIRNSSFQQILEYILFLKINQQKFTFKLISQKIIYAITEDIWSQLYEKILKLEYRIQKISNKNGIQMILTIQQILRLYTALSALSIQYGDKLHEYFLKKDGKKISQQKYKLIMLQELYKCKQKERQQKMSFQFLQKIMKDRPSIMFSKQISKQLLNYVQIEMLMIQTLNKFDNLKEELNNLSSYHLKIIKNLIQSLKQDFKSVDLIGIQSSKINKIYKSYKKKYCKCSNCKKISLD